METLRDALVHAVQAVKAGRGAVVEAVMDEEEREEAARSLKGVEF